jgi:spore germination protein YaaH
MRRRVICILAGLAVVAAVGPPSASAAHSCATAKPTRLKLTRDVGRTVAQLHWRAPRGAGRATSYRVTAGDAVVGQTRKRSMRVRVRIGARQRYTVTPMRSGRAAAGCAATRVIRVRDRAPGAPRDLTAEVADGVVRVAWKPARRGDRPVAGYRVYRDDDLLGQQGALTRDVKVAADRTYRFSVRAVDRRGRVGRSSATATVVTANQRPPAPTGVQAEVVSPSEVAVHWQPSVSSQNDVVGYRVFRNGTAVGQFQATEANLQNLPASTVVTVTVAAVDARGVVSEYSEPVTVRTFDKPGQVPPPAPSPPSGGGGGGGGAAVAVPSVPAGLQARALSESEVKLSWQPSSVPGGRVVGYRVRRNGVVVGQFEGTETTVSNLAPSTGFTFTVAAVSSQGMVSAESDPASATTLAPTPTTGTAQAFVLASTDQSFADFRAHYKQIGTIYPTYYDCTGSGDLIGKDDPLITGWAQARKVKVLPRINCQRSAVLTDVLRDPTLRERWLTAITQLVQAHDYDGIALDFEAGLAADRDVYTSFVTELAKRLHAMDKLLTVAVSAKSADDPDHPRSGFFDYAALDDSVDTVFVMDWGIHWSTSLPGPQSDLTWATKVADYIASLGAKDHYVLGTMLYGMDWPDGGGPDHEATARVYGELMEHLTAMGAQSVYDEDADEWHATYTDADGVKHDVWYPDATTIATRVRLAHDRGLAGVGFWRIGREDARIWDDPLIAPGAPWPSG